MKVLVLQVGPSLEEAQVPSSRIGLGVGIKRSSARLSAACWETLPLARG